MLMSSCESESEIIEQELGPYLVVFKESFEPYQNNNRIIDSIEKSLQSDNIFYSDQFSIIYEKPQNPNPHSICGVIINWDNTDSVLIRKLIRSNYQINSIGKTNCITLEIPKKNFNEEKKSEVYQQFYDYMKFNNLVELPNGENGITQIIKENKVIFAAEKKSIK